MSTVAVNKPPKKCRLDDLVVAARLAATREQAQRLIMAGRIRTGDRLWDKPGQLVPVDTPLSAKESATQYVSMGGEKLAAGLEAFPISVSGKRCLDIGASTGGFTQVLLQHGAGEVVALDVGYGQLAYSLTQDKRVKVLDRTNFRVLADDFFPEPFALIVTDVSFISLRIILPKARTFLAPDGDILALIKPQFEAPRADVPDGGIITDPAVHRRVILGLSHVLAPQGLFLKGILPTQPGGPRKNREFISWWRQEADGPPHPPDIPL